MIKVVFVLPSLTSGGAERVMSFLATQIDSEKFSSHLLIIGDDDEIAFTIENCETTFLYKNKVSKATLNIINFLRKTKPNIVIGAIAHVNAMLAFVSFFFPKISFLGRETLILSKAPQKKKKQSFQSLFYGLVPKRLDAIICQSEDMKKKLHEILNYPEHKLVIINNPISNRFKLKNPNSNTFKQLITVGRLVKVKGHKRLLQVLSKLIEIPFHYTIIGSGPEEENLKKQVDELDLSKKVSFIPFSNKVEKYLSLSDIFLQGSFSEGFPNALLESCAVGTPVLTFIAPGGTSEIVEEGVNGFIAINQDDFLSKLILILNSEWNPSQIRQSVIEKYNEEKILSEYERLFLDIYKKKLNKLARNEFNKA